MEYPGYTPYSPYSHLGLTAPDSCKIVQHDTDPIICTLDPSYKSKPTPESEAMLVALLAKMEIEERTEVVNNTCTTLIIK